MSAMLMHLSLSLSLSLSRSTGDLNFCFPFILFCRNIFCALCNGEKPESVLISRFSSDYAFQRSQTYAFSGLLKFGAEEEKKTIETDTRCDDGFVYDSIKVFL